MEILHSSGTQTFFTMVVFIAWVSYLVFAVWLSWIDIRSHLLPNRLIYPWFLTAAAGVLLLAVLSSQWASAAGAGLGAVAHSGCYLLLRVVSGGAMGMGDVKLAAVLGLYLGWFQWWLVFPAVLLSLVLGAVVSTIGMILKRLTLHSRIPLGPMILVATPLVVAGWALYS